MIPTVNLTRLGGYRLTRQRRLVLDILEGSHQHLDAESLFLQAKERDPNISLATVYRSLAVLKQAGLVQENRLGEDHAHFETRQAAPHFHFTCLQCGAVIEIMAPNLARSIRDLCAAQDLKISDLELNLTGTCSHCRQRDPNSLAA